VQLLDKSGALTLDADFLERVKQASGQPLDLCYQCEKCSSGCPAAEFMDLHPNQIVRYIQYGASDLVLRSEGIWLCSSCETCGARCPNGINMAEVMDVCREMALSAGVARAKRIVLFHRIFLDTVKNQGRMHELLLIGKYKLMSGQLLNDLLVGAKMFIKGKLAILPPRLRGREQVRQIFSRTGRRRGGTS